MKVQCSCQRYVLIGVTIIAHEVSLQARKYCIMDHQRHSFTSLETQARQDTKGFPASMEVFGISKKNKRRSELKPKVKQTAIWLWTPNRAMKWIEAASETGWFSLTSSVEQAFMKTRLSHLRDRRRYQDAQVLHLGDHVSATGFNLSNAIDEFIMLL